MKIEAIIFDLDGVIVSTDEYHYQGWKKLADEEGIFFDREINHRLRGVSRMESLDILLERSSRTYTDEQKIEMAGRKNDYYRQLLQNITPADILPGVLNILNELKQRGIKMAIGSSSRNSPAILGRIGLADFFDATADGNDISNSKPDPEVFLLAAERLGMKPSQCLVVEDADAGVDAAIAGGFRCLAVGAAKNHPAACMSADDMESIPVDDYISMTRG
ncbi:MAG TPA: beta-phosphoglucomutase [Desulfobacteraceae bacterium]|nr:beta-phosphoglucomutase [Desulfobacteraceae bacterium]